jgi:hypothetical protein
MAILRTEIEAFQKESRLAIAQAQDKAVEQSGNVRDTEKDKAQEHLNQLEKLVDGAKLAASMVANDKISKYYSESANIERRSAKRWTGIALGSGLMVVGLVVTIIIISIFKPAEGAFASTLRILAPLIGGPLFLYAAYEARQHRSRAWALVDSAITHSTIGSMIAPLPKAMQNNLLLEAARKMYVNTSSSERDMGEHSTDDTTSKSESPNLASNSN